MMVHVRMDAEIVYEECLALPAPLLIFTYAVPRLLGRNFVLVSRSRGVLGYFQDEDLAWPFIRMRIRDAWRQRALLDFRVYRWDEAAGGWAIHVTTMQLEDLRESLAATRRESEVAA
jgi:hypothetical protein